MDLSQGPTTPTGQNDTVKYPFPFPRQGKVCNFLIILSCGRTTHTDLYHTLYNTPTKLHCHSCTILFATEVIAPSLASHCLLVRDPKEEEKIDDKIDGTTISSVCEGGHHTKPFLHCEQ